jgi:hypothetical protein
VVGAVVVVATTVVLVLLVAVVVAVVPRSNGNGAAVVVVAPEGGAAVCLALLQAPKAMDEAANVARIADNFGVPARHRMIGPEATPPLPPER